MMQTRVLSTVVLVLALLGALHVVMAQSSDEAAVAQAVEAFRNAMLKADRGQFEALTAEQLSYGHSGGRVETKAQFIDAATKRTIDLEVHHPDGSDRQHRRQYRDRAAHVHGRIR